jgi:hypothetical protein
VCGELTKGWRLSPRRIAGYFQFHFIDILPANWPKSIVSHDLRPKKAYYEMAQINQPVVPLPRITDQGRTMQLWVANDHTAELSGHLISWQILHNNEILLRGSHVVDVPASDAVRIAEIDLSSIPDPVGVISISSVLTDPSGARAGRYESEIFLKAWRVEKDIFNHALNPDYQ